MHPDDPEAKDMMSFVADLITWGIGLVLCLAAVLWWGMAS